MSLLMLKKVHIITTRTVFILKNLNNIIEKKTILIEFIDNNDVSLGYKQEYFAPHLTNILIRKILWDMISYIGLTK